jgi:hypothetical protein
MMQVNSGCPVWLIPERAVRITYCRVAEFHSGLVPSLELLRRRISIGLSQMSCV